jgi:hypothetical protein
MFLDIILLAMIYKFTPNKFGYMKNYVDIYTIIKQHYGIRLQKHLRFS